MAEAAPSPSAMVSLLYALPALPVAALAFAAALAVPTLYARDLGLGFAQTGLALLLARSVDVLCDPIIGWLSDRGDGRGRQPMMAVGAILVILAGWPLFRPNHLPGFSAFLVESAVFSVGLTLILVPYQAWAVVLVTGYHDRTRLVSWREGAGLLGLMAGLLAVAGGGETGPAPLRHFFPGAAAFLTLTLAMAMGRVPTGSAFDPSPVGQRGPSVWVALRKNRPFRQILVVQSVNALANAIPTTLFLLMVQRIVGRPGWAGPLLLLYVLSAVLTLPIWRIAARHWEKHRAWRCSLIYAVLAFFPVFFVTSTRPWLFVLVCGLTGIAQGADLVLPAAVVADTVDQHEAETGDLPAGLYIAVWSLCGKLALAFAVGLSFPLVGWLGDGVTAPLGPLLSHSGLVCLYAGLPILLKSIAIWQLGGFSLGEVAQQRLRQRINARLAALHDGGPVA